MGLLLNTEDRSVYWAEFEGTLADALFHCAQIGLRQVIEILNFKLNYYIFTYLEAC